MLIHRSFQLADVAVGNMAEAFGQRLERLVLFGLSCGVERGQGAPVKRAKRAYNLVSPVPGPAARQLESSFVGFSPRVAKEHLPAAVPSPLAPTSS